MIAGEVIGWTGATIGALCGIVGGAIGCYFSIKNTNGPRERQFVIRCVIGSLVFVGLFLAMLFLISMRYRWIIWVPYLVALPFVIRKWNSRQMAIRATKTRSAEN